MDLKEQLQLCISLKDDQLLSEIVSENYSVDIATELEDFEESELISLCGFASDKDLAEIIEQSNENIQLNIIKILEPSKIVMIFTHMSSDDIADIIGNLSINLRKYLLQLMKTSQSIEVTQLLGYSDDTAGRIMTMQYIALRSELTIDDALKKIKEIGPKTEVIETLFIINADNILIGTVDLRDILTSIGQSTLEEITNKNYISVYPETDQEEVSLLVSKYDLRTIPVVNRRKSILGIITIDDIIDVIVEEQTEDILMLSGVSKDETTDTKFVESIRLRLPWLVVNLLTAFLAAFVVSLFEETIVQVAALAAAMPIVAGMGGNSGTQTLGIVIRSIALGEINLKDDWKLVLKEVGLGLVHGSICGIIAGVVLSIFYGNIYFGIIILISMIANLIIAGFFGFLVPLILKKLKFDPASSATIFVTTCTDVGGFLVFLGLATLFIEKL